MFVSKIFGEPASVRKLTRVRLEKGTRTVVTWAACTALEMDTVERECCVRGYHIYSHIWEASVGEVLDCRCEPDNANDRYAKAVVKRDTIVVYLPRKLSRILLLFARRGGVYSKHAEIRTSLLTPSYVAHGLK